MTNAVPHGVKPSLSSTIMLQRARSLRVQITSEGVRLLVGGKGILFGPQGLAVLDLFAQPMSLGEALQTFKARGVQHWMDMASTIMALHRAGALRDVAQDESPLVPAGGGFGSVSIHVAMLNDRIRTAGFMAGIAEVVCPRDVVVDIGTGTGILAVAAARAGAAHVYAVEATEIASVARAVFEANGLTERITLIQGWSTEIELPERADVLVSEIVGNDPWDERILEVTQDARKRLLKPTARFVPGRMRVFGLPVTVPHVERMQRTVTAETVNHWKSWYNVDYSPLAEMVRNAAHPQFYLKPQQARDWTQLSDPALLAEVDFATFHDRDIAQTITATATASGELSGLLVYFELMLGPTTTLSTHPAHADAYNCWKSPVFLVGEPWSVQTGDHFVIDYHAGSGRPSEVHLSKP